MRLPVLVTFACVLVAGCVDLNTGQGSSSGTTGGTSDGGTSTSSTTLRAFDVQGLCTRLINDCGQLLDQASCVKSYLPVRVTDTCASLITSASCADLTSDTSTVTATCFPVCAGSTLAKCNGNGTITVCTDTGRQNVDDCSAYCTAQGYTEWTGICGNTYNGQTSDRDQCWCK